MIKNIKYLIEQRIGFNPADYDNEDDYDQLNNQETKSILNKLCKYHPRTKTELLSIIEMKLDQEMSKLKRKGIKTLEPYLSDIDVSRITDMSYLFSSATSSYSKYKSARFKFDLSQWDVSHVTDMHAMFLHIGYLISLNVSGWNTVNVTNMNEMFAYTGIKELDLSGWDTSNVNDMSLMFTNCNKLKKLDLSNFNTSNVTCMHGMFYGCISLKTIDLSGWDTSNVDDMGNMFMCCESLKKLDLSNFSSQSLREMQGMFYGCIDLTSLDISSFHMTKPLIANANSVDYFGKSTFTFCKPEIIPDWYEQ